MAVSSVACFYTGLVLIALGTGLLKPNISAMVGQLYSDKDERRDAGFSIFYMGINLGAFLSPIIVGFLAQHIWFRNFISSMGFDPKSSWHFGFGAAGVGMTLGLIQYVVGRNRLRNVGAKPEKWRQAKDRRVLISLRGVSRSWCCHWRCARLLLWRRWSCLSLVPRCRILFAGYLFGTLRMLEGNELKNVLIIFILFLFSIVFWMTFEQSGSSLTLFADRLTQTTILGWAYPSSWFQSVQPIFVILLAPVFAGIWQKMGSRQPSSPGKFFYGLLFAGLAFVVVTIASMLTGGGRVSPLWLIVVYFLQSIGELCLSPVGLSTVTKLAPARMVGLMMVYGSSRSPSAVTLPG